MSEQPTPFDHLITTLQTPTTTALNGVISRICDRRPSHSGADGFQRIYDASTSKRDISANKAATYWRRVAGLAGGAAVGRIARGMCIVEGLRKIIEVSLASERRVRGWCVSRVEAPD